MGSKNISGRSYVKADHDFWADLSFSVYEESTSTENNTSRVRYEFYACQRTGFSFTGTTRNPAGRVVVNINGSDVDSANIGLINYGTGECYKQGYVTVPHNSDGTKEMSFSIRMDEVAGNFSGDTWKYGATSVSSTLWLASIPRASSISVTSGSGTKPGGGSIKLSISRASSAFTHTVTWSYHDLTGTVGTGIGTSATWDVPLSFIEKSPSADTWMTFVCKTYSNGTEIGSSSCTANIGHYQPSSISNYTSNIICNGTNTINVTISRGHSSFVHDVEWAFGSHKYKKTNQGTSSSYAPPTSWLDAISSANSGIGSVVVTTYYKTTKIGSVTSPNFTLNVPDYALTLGSVTVEKIQPDSMRTWDILVQNKSNVKFTFNNAATSDHATIKQYTIEIDGMILSSDTNIVRTERLPTAGTVNYIAKIYDSRNRSVSLTGSIEVQPLVIPKLVSEDISRYNGTDKDDDGEKLYFNVSFSYESYNNLNSTTNKIYIRPSVATNYTEYGTFQNGRTLIISDYTFSMVESYDIKIVVIDTLGNKLEHVFNLGVSYAIIDISNTGKGIGLLTMSKIEGFIELGKKVWAYDDIIGETSLTIQSDQSTFISALDKNSKIPTFESGSMGNYMQKLTITNEYASWLNNQAFSTSYIELFQDEYDALITISNGNTSTYLSSGIVQTGYILAESYININGCASKNGAILSNNKDNQEWRSIRLYRNDYRALYGISNNGSPCIERHRPNEEAYNTRFEINENDIYFSAADGPGFKATIKDNSGHGGIRIGQSTNYLKWLRNSQEIQVRNNADNAYSKITASAFVNGSKKKFKENIEDVNDDVINNIVMDNDIKKYNLISEREEIEKIEQEAEEQGIILDPDQLRINEKTGLILEDLTDEAKQILNPERTEGIDLYTMISLLWRHNQIQQNKIDCLEAKLDMLSYQINNL